MVSLDFHLRICFGALTALGIYKGDIQAEIDKLNLPENIVINEVDLDIIHIPGRCVNIDSVAINPNDPPRDIIVGGIMHAPVAKPALFFKFTLNNYDIELDFLGIHSRDPFLVNSELSAEHRITVSQPKADGFWNSLFKLSDLIPIVGWNKWTPTPENMGYWFSGLLRKHLPGLVDNLIKQLIAEIKKLIGEIDTELKKIDNSFYHGIHLRSIRIYYDGQRQNEKGLEVHLTLLLGPIMLRTWRMSDDVYIRRLKAYRTRANSLLKKAKINLALPSLPSFEFPGINWNRAIKLTIDLCNFTIN